jgi:hypothetical protein
MNYTTCSFKHAEIILHEPRSSAQYDEITAVLTSITDDIITKHDSYSNAAKSISRVINDLLKERFLTLDRSFRSPIFQPSDHTVGTFVKFLDQLLPLQGLLTAPLLIIGLKPLQALKFAMDNNE